MERDGFTYGSVTLRQTDIRLFSDGNWLNDQCISFYIEYLSRLFPQEKYVFLEPGTAFLIAFEEDLDDLCAGIHRLDLSTPDLIFLPINDNPDPGTAAGGSHWTLLVLSKRTWTWYHFNSLGLGGRNLSQARVIARKLGKVLGSQDLILKEIQVQPSQRNAFDCGIYVLHIAFSLICQIRTSPEYIEADLFPDVFDRISPAEITEKRREIEEILRELKCRRK